MTQNSRLNSMMTIPSRVNITITIDTPVKEIIEQYVSEKGLRKEKRSAVVMRWWVPVSVQSSGV